jgi:competence protein ComEC
MFSFFRKSPLVIICLFFVAGIHIEFKFQIVELSAHITALLLFCAIGWLLIKKRFLLLQVVLLCLLSFCLGSLSTYNFIKKDSILKNKYVQIEFHIEKKLRPNQYIGSTNRNRFLVEFKNNDTLQTGDKLIANGLFQEIQPPKLPWVFDQKKQMLSNGIALEFQIQQVHSISEIDRKNFRFLPNRIQKHFQNNITSAIPDTADAAILSALLLGETSLLTKEITSDYSIAGVVHILAVSGMHVALIYELILFVLKFILRKKRKWLTFFLAMSLLWSYGAITGFSASVVRACCMFSFFVISDCFLLSRKTANTIAGSTLLILFFQPYLIFNLGFLLSLSAVLGIVVIHPLIMRPLYTENKISYYLLNSTSITLSAQIATLPITLYIFHSFPTYFILANLILVPWSSLILYLGIAFLFTSGIPIIGVTITFILQLVTSSMNDFIHLVNLLPNAQLNEISFNLEQTLTAYSFLIVLFIFIFFRWKQAIHLCGILTLLFIFCCYQVPSTFATVFTYYKSNVMLLGTEKGMTLACNDDSIADKYISKLNIWKCQQNRHSQTIWKVHFPQYFEWKEGSSSQSFATFSNREKSNCLLLNEELKGKKIDTLLLNEIQHEKIMLGQGISRKKKEFLVNSLKDQKMNFQNLQSHPFNLK